MKLPGSLLPASSRLFDHEKTPGELLYFLWFDLFGDLFYLKCLYSR